MAKLKDLSKAQVLYDALMIVTSGNKNTIRDICNALQAEDVHGNICDNHEISSVAGRINFHLIEQGY